MSPETVARLADIQSEFERLVNVIENETTDAPNELTYDEYCEMFRALRSTIPQFDAAIKLLDETKRNWE